MPFRPRVPARAAHAVRPAPTAARRRRAPAPLTLLAILCLGASSCVNPRAQAAMAQALNDAANEIGGLRNDVADLQLQLDSLRTIVAKQDTLIDRIMMVNNIPR